MKTYACVLSTNNYLMGVLALNENLKRFKSKYGLICLINENITEETRNVLKKHNINYKEFKSVKYNVDFECAWNYTFDKFNVFLLEEYEKVVCLDVDLLILSNLDFLFDYETPAMVIDNPTYTDRYNSGVMVITPSKETFEILDALKEKESKKNCVLGDQNILNDYYLENYTIHRIPDEYNVIRTITKEKIPYLDPLSGEEQMRYRVIENAIVDDPAVIHYIGENKPFSIDAQFAEINSDLYFDLLDAVKEIGV